jgi:hypothetical protein
MLEFKPLAVMLITSKIIPSIRKICNGAARVEKTRAGYRILPSGPRQRSTRRSNSDVLSSITTT